jgi:ATP-dependent RNA helicase RhlE
MTENINSTPSFGDLGLTSRVAAAVNGLGFTVPTPIQLLAIPAGLSGRDVVGIAQTGTGKTLAFGLPIVERLLGSGSALVLAPTRELALQIEETMRSIGAKFGLRSVVLIGGASMGRQISQLRARPQIIIATPGRLLDHLNQGTVRLDKITVAVLDEADRMLDMGFLPAIKKILQCVPKERQTMLFSATMPAEIANLSGQFLRNPVRVEGASPYPSTRQARLSR